MTTQVAARPQRVQARAIAFVDAVPVWAWLTAIVSVKLRDPQFEGQTKAKLGNSDVGMAVQSVAAEALAHFLENNPNDARRIVEK